MNRVSGKERMSLWVPVGRLTLSMVLDMIIIIIIFSVLFPFLIGLIFTNLPRFFSASFFATSLFSLHGQVSRLSTLGMGMKSPNE